MEQSIQLGKFPSVDMNWGWLTPQRIKHYIFSRQLDVSKSFSIIQIFLQKRETIFQLYLSNIC